MTSLRDLVGDELLLELLTSIQLCFLLTYSLEEKLFGHFSFGIRMFLFKAVDWRGECGGVGSFGFFGLMDFSFFFLLFIKVKRQLEDLLGGRSGVLG